MVRPSSARAGPCSPPGWRGRDLAGATRGDHAELDPLEIWVHVARRDPSAADRLIDRFTATIERLAARPMMGRAVEHLLPGLQSFSVGDYLIFYRADVAHPGADGIYVVRIVHGARNITPEFFE